MERLRKHQWLEQGIYGTIWLVVFMVPLIGGYFAVRSGIDGKEIWTVICGSWISILPFFLLFVLNNYWLVPCRLFRKKYGQYAFFLICIIGNLSSI